MDYDALFAHYNVKDISGRYIPLENIEPVLKLLNKQDELQIGGFSVEHRPIYSYIIGKGKIRILMWSQMHGNESTTTKALLDFINFIHEDKMHGSILLDNFTFCLLPMLNPDGAKKYTRENANGIDLNRDALNLSQPESKILRNILTRFNPDYCYNLHDQRTIFGVSDTGKPATLSFLAPAYNENRDINQIRLKSINLISVMNAELQKVIPGQIGRFDDTFNLNCVGDMFQFLNFPTLLFEAGHYPNDYEREVTRKFIFTAIISGLKHLSENVVVLNGLHDYLLIPQNKPCFFDFVYKYAKNSYDSTKIFTNFALQFNEELFNNKLNFNAYVAKIGDLENYFGHTEFDLSQCDNLETTSNLIEINQKADFFLGKNIEVVNGKLVI